MANNYKGKNQKGNNNNKGKNGKSYSNNKGSADRRSDRSKSYKQDRDYNKDDTARNDASWYEVDNQIMRDAARVSFNNPLGMDVTTITDVIGGNKFSFPGVAAIAYSPAIGEASQANSPSNMSAKRLMAYLRSKVSTKLGFSAADAMMYLLAMDGLFSFHAYCKRLYGLHRTYMAINRYYPDKLFWALGLKADSTTEWNDFRSWFNRWTYKVSQLYVPASITYFDRHQWMNSNVYLDAPDAKAQSFIFVPTRIYQWDGSTDPNGTRLTLEDYPITPCDYNGPTGTLAQVQAFGDQLLEKLLQDLDIAEMSGMVLRAYGEGNCRKLDVITEDYMVAPVFNAEVLTQIHNATICGTIVTDSGIITQTQYDTLAVTYNTSCLSTQSLRHLSKDIILDLPMLNPTEDDIFVATRLTARGTVDSETEDSAVLTVYGTEIIEYIQVYDNHQAWSYPSSCIEFNSGSPLSMQKVARSSAFSSFPITYVALKKTGTLTSDLLYDLNCNISNYTVITDLELEKIHSAAALSLFTIPVVG